MANGPSPSDRIADIHSRVGAQIDAPQAGFETRPLMDALDELAPQLGNDKDPDLLEARVMLVVASGRRARRAQKPLYHHFRACLANGNSPRFEAFETRLKKAEQNGASLEGLFFPKAFGSVDQSAVWAKIEEVMAKLQGEGGEAFLCCGTLLGAVRDKSLIAHDDDVDLAYVLRGGTHQEAAAQWRQVYSNLLRSGLLKGEVGANPCSLKLKSDTSYNIDLFPAWVSDGRVQVYPYVWGELREEDVFPLIPCPTTGLPIPRDAEAMLAASYGENWKTPDPGFKTAWGRLNRRFAPFRDALDF